MAVATVNDFSEVPQEELFEVSFHRNTSGKIYWDFKINGTSIKELDAKSEEVIKFIQDKIKEKGWQET